MTAPLVPFLDEVHKVLVELDEAQENYWTTCLKADGVEHVETISLDQHRWYTVKLDVYRRKLDGALVGVRWDSPATEEQEDQDRNAQAVDVEEVTVTSYRVKPS